MTWKWLTGKTVSATFIRLDKVDPAMSGILGCLSDISYQEERMQEAERRRIEAEESKKQQELIVDVTSHEIRTPVSAILHCSSLVKENLAVIQAHLKRGDSLKPSEDLLRQIKEDIEALESRSMALTCRLQ
jgi:signal transduction histidine kinase